MSRLAKGARLNALFTLIANFLLLPLAAQASLCSHLLGSGQGGTVTLEATDKGQWYAKKVYFESEEFLNDRSAWLALNGLPMRGVRLVKIILTKGLVVHSEYIEGPRLSDSLDNKPAQDLYRSYVQHLRKELEAKTFFGLLRMEVYENASDHLPRLNAKLRGPQGHPVFILIRPENFIVSSDELVLVDPH